MNGHLRLVGADDHYNFEFQSFEAEPNFRSQWADSLSADYVFLTDMYWRLKEDNEVRVCNAIARLMLGNGSAFPEFAGIGFIASNGSYIQNEVQHEAGFLSAVTRPGTRFLNPVKTLTNLVEATNEQLLALNSFYHLPIE